MRLGISINVNERVLDISFGPEGVDEEVILVGQDSDQESESKAGPLQPGDIGHDSAYSNDGCHSDSYSCEIFLQSVGLIKVVTGRVNVDGIHDTKENLEENPNYGENPVVPLVPGVRVGIVGDHG